MWYRDKISFVRIVCELKGVITMNIDVGAILQKVYDGLAAYGLRIVGAIIILVVGRWLARLLSKLAVRAMKRAKVEDTLVRFGENILYIALLVFVALAALEILRIKTTSFVAVLAAAGLAIGLALQGSLANFAAGVLMIIFKPFKVGDFVEVAGTKGTVREIQIFNTVLDSPDNIKVIVPNAQVTGTNILNYTVNGTRRVDLVIGVSYDDDLKKASQVINEVLANDDRVLDDPPAKVAVYELGDSSVNFVVRPWVKSADYWDAYFDITQQVKLSLEQNGLTIPYPQRDIHVKDGALSGRAT
jgi:small conductance mechanosensitive channel